MSCHETIGTSRELSTSDADNPAIIEKARDIKAGLHGDVEQARALFEWMRDTIPHSRDIGAQVLTCSASQVLLH